MEDKQKEILTDRFLLGGFCEAQRLLDEGIATIKDIDLAMRAGAGFAQGPFALADSLGLDVVLQRLEDLQKTYGDRFAPPPMLCDLVARGHLGRKTNKGYYEYTA